MNLHLQKQTSQSLKVFSSYSFIPRNAAAKLKRHIEQKLMSSNLTSFAVAYSCPEIYLTIVDSGAEKAYVKNTF